MRVQKNVLLLLALGGLLIFGCQAVEKGDQYGEPLTLTETTKLAALLAEPEQYLGQRVRVEGTIVDVCEKQGCWIELAGEDATQKIRVKVDDGVIVFPVEAKGKKAIAEGEVYKIELDHAQAIGYMEHLAEEKGVPFDSTSVTGPMVIYQIKGHGALIEKS